jgi:uncharacterized protein (UPF0548 family)
VFKLAKSTPDDVRQAVETACHAEFRPAKFLASRIGLKITSLPSGFAHDRSHSILGRGEAVFSSAVCACEQWRNFDLGWVRVANPTARIELAEVVAVQVHSLGLWSLNLSRIVEVIRDPLAFGFIYKTTVHHVEEGEERFLVTMDGDSGKVEYTLEAVSRPRALLARLGFPVTRAFQHRFARDSHCRMQKVATV